MQANSIFKIINSPVVDYKNNDNEARCKYTVAKSSGLIRMATRYRYLRTYTYIGLVGTYLGI